MIDRHNLNYWRGGDYIGVGPGAVSRFTDLDGFRWDVMQHKVPQRWMEGVEKGDSALESTRLTKADQISEIILMGLRVTDGLSRSDFLRHSHGKQFEQVSFFFFFFFFFFVI